MDSLRDKLRKFVSAFNTIIKSQCDSFGFMRLRNAEVVDMTYDGSMQQSEEFIELKNEIEQDPYLGRTREFGIETAAKDILRNLVRLSVNYNTMELDFDKAIQVLIEARSSLESCELRCKFRIHLHGVEIEEREVVLAEGIKLVKLSSHELEARFRFCNEYERAGVTADELVSHSTEIHISLIETVVDSNLYTTYDNASNKAKKISANILMALYLTMPGRIELGVRIFDHLLLNQITSYNFIKRLVHGSEILRACANETLRENYRLVNEEVDRDKVLSIAVKRFSLGQQRYSLEDRIIDYVIAWEALLLTVNGSSPNGELSYRFALNGSSILFKCPINLERPVGLKKMKELYNNRSKIVHGSEVDSIQLMEQIVECELWLREVLRWLGAIPRNERPYNKVGAWEEMTWN